MTNYYYSLYCGSQMHFFFGGGEFTPSNKSVILSGDTSFFQSSCTPWPASPWTKTAFFISEWIITLQKKVLCVVTEAIHRTVFNLVCYKALFLLILLTIWITSQIYKEIDGEDLRKGTCTEKAGYQLAGFRCRSASETSAIRCSQRSPVTSFDPLGERHGHNI